MEQEPPASLGGRLLRQYQSASHPLITAGESWAAALLICCGLDAFGALFRGQTGLRSSREDFIAFVVRYLSIFDRELDIRYEPIVDDGIRMFVSPGTATMRWASLPGRSVTAADVLYRSFRSGLVHQGGLPRGVSVVDHASPAVYAFRVEHTSSEIAARMDLNVRPFQQEFEAGVTSYLSELAGSNELAARFRRRWDSISGSQWLLAYSDPPAAPAEKEVVDEL